MDTSSYKYLSNILFVVIFITIFLSTTSMRYYLRRQERKLISENTTNEQFYNYLLMRTIVWGFAFIVLAYVYYLTNKGK